MLLPEASALIAPRLTNLSLGRSFRRSGGVLALKGECPACTQEVYSFLQVRPAPAPAPDHARPCRPRLLLRFSFPPLSVLSSFAPHRTFFPKKQCPTQAAPSPSKLACAPWNMRRIAACT